MQYLNTRDISLQRKYSSFHIMNSYMIIVLYKKEMSSKSRNEL